MNRFERFLCRVFRVPHEPHPPAGAESSIRTFRAAQNYYYYNLLGWGLKQAAALVGFLVFLSFMIGVEAGSRMPWESLPLPAIEEVLDAVGADEDAAEIGEKIWWWLNTWIWRVIETVGLALFVMQLPITYAMVRLDYKMRWYIVTDRSLRIREGIWHVREMTMTFANVQNIEVSQGPLQRIFGIADLKVQTAGGGGMAAQGKQGQEGVGFNMHLGFFRGIENAQEVRDMMLERLRRYRDAGLGDLDESHAPETQETAPELESLLSELGAEAAGLRRAAEALR